MYTEPTDEPAKGSAFDITAVHTADSAATFTSIELKGDFYNGMGAGKNRVLTFEDATVEGVISASKAVHRVSTIDASNFHELGIVTNTARAAVNNGAIVALNSGSTWTVTGTSYLTGLTLAADASVRAPRGKNVTPDRRQHREAAHTRRDLHRCPCAHGGLTVCSWRGVCATGD
ncbi:hypothetical protein QQM39_41460 [Streptomyces sp. DT2A-34]|uniref:hypothetical protein n=1 Tax=Streptomyces sp. DT2A-34 TaxID=3051182 RepID=UPI00265BAEF2|nr:hypothetical protein [Streptomyces sp. DT2A-34]MDO0917041.1 hypothetical protein [Streptomyces sp. DT2A-34]